MADIKVNEQTGDLAVPNEGGGYRVYKQGEYKFNSQTNQYAVPADGGWKVYQHEKKSGIFPFKENIEGGYDFDITAGIPGAIMDAVGGGAQTMKDVAEGRIDPAGQEAVSGTLPGVMLMTPVGAAARAGERAIPGVAKALRPVEPKVPTAQALKQASDAGYTKAREMGVDYSPDAIKSFADDFRQRLEQKGFREKRAPGTFDILKELSNPPEGSVAVTLTDLDVARQQLGDVAGDFLNKTDKKAATKSIEALDKFLMEPDQKSVVAGPATAAAETLKDARGNFAAAMRSDKVTGKAERAELDAAAAHSGQNLDNRTRQILKSIIDPERPKNARGYSKEELALIDDIVRGKYGVNFARWMGNFLGGGGGLGAFTAAGFGTAAGGAAGAFLGGPAGAGLGAAAGGALPIAAGLALRKFAGKLTTSQTKKLDELIRTRSPLYQQALKNPQMAPQSADLRFLLGRGLMMGGPGVAGGLMNQGNY